MGSVTESFPELVDWQRRAIDGGVILSSPDGTARIRLRPRLPCEDPSELVARIVQEVGGARAQPASHRFVTHDGELGGLSTVCVRRADGTLRDVAIGIVATGALLCVDGVAVADWGIADLVSRLARSCGGGSGRARVRMFEYQPPAGWHGVRRDAATAWLHADYPRTPSCIKVFDARPVTTNYADTLHRLMFLRSHERRLESQTEPVASCSNFGLHGRTRTAAVRQATGEQIVRRAAAFADDQFIYQATLEAPAGDGMSSAAFDRLIESFRPLPSGPSCAKLAMSHWGT